MVGWKALVSGLTGAIALTTVHETARRELADAPRMDLLGMQAIRRSMTAISQQPPGEERLHEVALAGDVIANSAYYSLVALGKPEGAWIRGALLGLAAGIGAVALPGPLGLDKSPSSRSTATQAMTIGWYLLGGIAAAGAYRLLARHR